METKTNKPQHTQGELEIVEVTDKMRQEFELSTSDCFILRPKSAPHMHIATIHNWNPKGDAERIFKAVNMHDELVKALTKCIGIIEGEWPEEQLIDNKEHVYIVAIRELLKKAQNPE